MVFLMSFYLIVSLFVIVILAIGWQFAHKEYLHYLLMFNRDADKCMELEAVVAKYRTLVDEINAATRKCNKEE